MKSLTEELDQQEAGSTRGTSVWYTAGTAVMGGVQVQSYLKMFQQ